MSTTRDCRNSQEDKAKREKKVISVMRKENMKKKQLFSQPIGKGEVNEGTFHFEKMKNSDCSVCFFFQNLFLLYSLSFELFPLPFIESSWWTLPLKRRRNGLFWTVCVVWTYQVLICSRKSKSRFCPFAVLVVFVCFSFFPIFLLFSFIQTHFLFNL